MPLYYFDVRQGSMFLPDDHGKELPDLTTAEREAAEAAIELGPYLLPKPGNRQVTIEVRDEHRQRVLTATISLRIDRPEPSTPRAT